MTTNTQKESSVAAIRSNKLKKYISRDEVLPKEESYESFKLNMIKSYGEKRWEVIESFLWTQPQDKIEKNLSMDFGTISQLFAELDVNSNNWWQEELEEKSIQ